MSEKPEKDYKPETLVKIEPDSWGEWTASASGKWYRPAVSASGESVRVYQSGVVQGREANGKAVIRGGAPDKRIQSSEDARSLLARRYEKARDAFAAGLVEGAIPKIGDRIKVPGLLDAWGLVGSTMLDIATNEKRGRDAVMAAKFIGQAADLIPDRGRQAAETAGGGLHLHFASGDLAELVGALRGAAEMPASGGLVIDNPDDDGKLAE